ncbi:MAG TPA: aminopeptidase P family N-terminal domain-containing protein, partial [Kofleriaceae bacterium]
MSNVIGRRQLLGSLAAIAAVPACTASRSAGTALAPAAPTGTAPTGTAPASPASVATASRSKYPPLPPLGDATFARRHDRLRALAREVGAGVAFITSGTTSFAYLAGGRVERSERLIALVLPVEGAPFLVAPAFEVERMRRQTRIRDVRPWEEHE